MDRSLFNHLAWFPVVFLCGWLGLTVGCSGTGSNFCEVAEPPVPANSELALNYINRTFTQGEEIATQHPVLIGASAGIPTTYQLTSGALPTGLSLDPATGAVTGVPTVVNDFSFTITATNGTRTTAATATYRVTAPVTAGYTNVVTTVNTALTVAPTHSTAIGSAALASGDLPAGLTLNADGSLTGSPSAAGVYPLQVSLCNAGGCIVRPVVITVNAATADPVKAGYTDASTMVGTPLSVPLSSYASLSPLASASLRQGTMPAGMTLDGSSGAIAGTPSAAGVYPLVIDISNGTGGHMPTPVTITVSAAGATPIGADYTDTTGLVGTPKSVAPNVTSGGPAVAATLTSGSLPSGMFLTANGTIAGTPTVPGTYVAEITLRNASGALTTQPVTITINEVGATAMAANYTDATTLVGSALTVTPAVTTGGPAVSARLVNGSLPPGMALVLSGANAGRLSGTPTMGGFYTMDMQLCNADGGCTIVPATITVNQPLTLNYDTPVTYSVNLGITPNLPKPAGGTPTSYTITSGSLPPGLSLNPSTGAITGVPTTPTALGSVGITGTNSSGSDNQTLSITVVAAPTFTANPSTIAVGQSTSLTSIFGLGTASVDNGVGAILSGNSVSVGPFGSAGDYSYHLIVTSPQGPITLTQVIHVIPLPADRITLSVPEGGNLPGTEVTDPASPLYGVKLTAPEQGPGTCGAVNLTVIREADLPSGSSIPAGASQVSGVYNLSTDVGYPFRNPVTFSLPYTPTAYPTDVPVPFLWDSAYNKWIAAGLKGIDVFGGTNRRVRFTTLLPGRYVVMVVPNLLANLSNADSGFVASSDALGMGNQGTYQHPGGASLGISSFQAWYKGVRGSANLHAALTAGPAQRALISRLASGTLGSWNQVWNQSAYGLNDQQTGLALVTALKVTGQPQLLVMNDTGHADSAVAALVSKYATAGNLFTVVDPNYPLDNVTLAWTPAATVTGFDHYTRAAGYTPTFEKFAFEGQSTVHRLSDYEIALDGALSGWTKPPFATLTIADIGGKGAVADNGTILVDNLTNTVTGSIDNGSEIAASVLVSQNGGARSPEGLSGGTPPSFNFDVTLADPYGTTVMLETTPTPCDPTFTHSGFMEFLVKQTGLPDFFQDLCFDTDTLTVPPPTPWSNSSWWQTNNLTGGTITSRAGTWSAVVASGTDTNVSNAGFTLNRSYSGTQSLRINDAVTGVSTGRTASPVSSVYQEAAVPNVAGAHPKLVFYWAACLEDNGHSATEQPFVDIQVEVMTGPSAGDQPLTKHFYANDPSYTGWVTPGTTGPGDAPWRVIPWQKTTVAGLDGYKGEMLRITITAGGCTPSGHAGYAYLDSATCE